jgi:RNA recognition motif-containing protein
VGKKLYVGNLSYGTTDSDLQGLFGSHGTVQSAQVIMDRDTGRSKGFGFVEMDSGEQAQAAMNSDNYLSPRATITLPHGTGVQSLAGMATN